MSTEGVTRRPHKVIANKAKRWSAPANEKGFSPSFSTPDQITRDVRGLKLRQRVSIVLGDEVLREELEEVVGNVDFSSRTTNLQSVRTYQDFLVPTSGLSGPSLPASFAVAPISDIRGMNTIKFSKDERLLRCKLASVYRLANDLGWHCAEDQVFCTARAIEDDYYYFTAPWGMMNVEITASSLIKMDQEGNTVETGNTNFPYNKQGNQAHCILYEALQDINCVMFVSAMEVMAVSAMDCGLLPISHDAVAVGEVNYYTLSSYELTKEDKEDIASKCKGIDKVLFLRNMGALCIGKSIEETFHIAHLLTQACKFQIQALRAGLEQLIHIDKEKRQQIYQSVHEGSDANQNKRKSCEILFEAFMRRLDAKGHKTGYNYSVEVFKQEQQPAPKIPKARTPATKSSSFNYPDDKVRSPVRRAHTTGRGMNRTKLKWLNEPIKSTGYRKEPNLDSPGIIEDAIIKNEKPEKDNKDLFKNIMEETVNAKEETTVESSPSTSNEQTKVTTVIAVQEVGESSKEKLDQSSGSLDDSKLLSPEGDEKGKKRKKVKKSRSFKDTLKDKLGMTKKEKKQPNEV